MPTITDITTASEHTDTESLKINAKPTSPRPGLFEISQTPQVSTVSQEASVENAPPSPSPRLAA